VLRGEKKPHKRRCTIRGENKDASRRGQASRAEEIEAEHQNTQKLPQEGTKKGRGYQGEKQGGSFMEEFTTSRLKGSHKRKKAAQNGAT